MASHPSQPAGQCVTRSIYSLVGRNVEQVWGILAYVHTPKPWNNEDLAFLNMATNLEGGFSLCRRLPWLRKDDHCRRSCNIFLHDWNAHPDCWPKECNGRADVIPTSGSSSKPILRRTIISPNGKGSTTGRNPECVICYRDKCWN